MDRVGFLRSAASRLIIGFGLFAVVMLILVESFDADDVWRTLGLFPWRALAGLLAVALLVNVLKALRFYIFVRHVGLPLGFWKTVRVFFASQAATPLPGGEAIRATLLKRETKERLGKAASPVVSQAVYEIGAAATVILAASFIYPDLLVPTLIVIGSLSLFLSVVLHRGIFGVLLKFFSIFPYVRYRLSALRHAQEHLRQNFLLLEEGGFDSHVVAAMFTAFLAQVAGGALVLLAAQAMGVHINIFQAMLVYAGGAMLQGLFTMIPAGLGVTEGGMSGILHLLGVELSLAVALVIIIRLMTLVFPVALGFVVFCLFYARQTFLPERAA
jgi:glycosyltransferase 2 family protein